MLQVSEMGSYKMVINQTRQKRKRKRGRKGSRSKKKKGGGLQGPAIWQATEFKVKKDVQR